MSMAARRMALGGGSHAVIVKKSIRRAPFRVADEVCEKKNNAS
jgi:hypothetical protein